MEMNNIKYFYEKEDFKLIKGDTLKIDNVTEHHKVLTLEELFKDWHNDRYLKQCLLNLQEKYDCGGITQEEWDKIYNKFSYIID